MESWKTELKRMKLAETKEKAPGFYELSGGDKMQLKPWKDTTANGLTKCIVDWINLSGGSATRISSMGTVRKINGQMKWTHGNTRKGVADVHGIVKGRHVSVEVKIGRDSMSKDQYREKERVIRAGGLYYEARDMESFVKWYKETFENA